eukprot:13686648-Ditylum_brightwellii.AAC.1
MHKGKIKSLVWDDCRQSCVKWHHVEGSNKECGRSYSHCTKILEISNNTMRGPSRNAGSSETHEQQIKAWSNPGTGDWTSTC